MSKSPRLSEDEYAALRARLEARGIPQRPEPVAVAAAPASKPSPGKRAASGFDPRRSAGHATVGGKRYYFRSRWERNWAFYLEWLRGRGEIKGWRYEAVEFWFHGIKRGTVSYKTDFEVTNLDDSVVFHEIKGRLDSRSKTKLKRMQRYYPEVRVYLIGPTQYKAVAARMRGILHEWE